MQRFCRCRSWARAENVAPGAGSPEHWRYCREYLTPVRAPSAWGGGAPTRRGCPHRNQHTPTSHLVCACPYILRLPGLRRGMINTKLNYNWMRRGVRHARDHGCSSSIPASQKYFYNPARDLKRTQLTAGRTFRKLVRNLASWCSRILRRQDILLEVP